jgi:hypothetical protein
MDEETQLIDQPVVEETQVADVLEETPVLTPATVTADEQPTVISEITPVELVPAVQSGELTVVEKEAVAPKLYALSPLY